MRTEVSWSRIIISALAVIAATTSISAASEKEKASEANPVLSVLGEPLATCSIKPMTGWFRDGSCRTDKRDSGRHLVCAKMTAGFLKFTKGRGNDLSTPSPNYRFPGLKPGDGWCLCAVRWAEAQRAGQAPPVVLAATHEAALRYVQLASLNRNAVDGRQTASPTQETPAGKSLIDGK